MNHPTNQPCARTYALIMAHCTIRLCARTGEQMRQMVGATGDITSMSPEVVRSRFPKIEQAAALYNLRLAEYIKQKYSRGAACRASVK